MFTVLYSEDRRMKRFILPMSQDPRLSAESASEATDMQVERGMQRIGLNLWAGVGMTVCFVAAAVILVSGLAGERHGGFQPSHENAVLAVNR